MKKNALFGLALLATAFFALTSADYKSLEEQNAAIEKSVKTRVDEFIAKKNADCDAMVLAKANAMADQMIAAMPKSSFDKPKVVAPAPAKKPAKVTPKAVKPAPKPAPAPAPKPTPKANESDIKINKKGEDKAPAQPEAPKNNVDIKINKKGGGK
jgi:outer membrane biosynthesis protein TonB